MSHYPLTRPQRSGKRWWLLGLLVCLAVGQAPASLKAQGSQPQPRVSDPVWQAVYWNNIDLAGAPILVRAEPELNYNWGNGSPAPEVNSQRFSARWTRYLYFERDGLYRFALTSDDGSRLFIDDQLVIDTWYDHAAKTFVVDRQLRAGHHLLRVEYYNNSSPALVQFSWSSLNPPQPTIADWRGEYFNNRDLLGDPVLVRNDPSVDFTWGLGSPAPGVVNADNFSARWTRTINLPSGAYRFRVTVDDGVRLYVNNKRVIDQWRVQAAATFTSEPIRLSGATPIKIEYFEADSDARIQVVYERTDTPEPPAAEGWRGEYYNNTSFAGTPALVRYDPNIDFAWGFGSPAQGVVNSDDFAVRWNRTVQFAPGNYRFRLVVDDGARLWVNNALIMDQWKQQSAAEYSSDIYVPGGAIPIRLEYVEYREQATIQLYWAQIGGGDNGGGSSGGEETTKPVQPRSRWRGEYYNNPDLSGSPTLVREDRRIDFDWGYGSPDPAIPPDYFSVRWTNTFRFDAGVHRFTAETDDGVRLWVDDKLIIDKWGVQARTQHAGEIRLAAGNHTVRMQYEELNGYAFARLTIARIVEGPSAVGNIITCVPPQPFNYAWIKLYRLDTNNRWVSMGKGIGAINLTGFLKIDGLPVNVGRFGNAGEPYKVEQWIDGKVARSTGDFLRGEPEFRVRPFVDNITPWSCGR